MTRPPIHLHRIYQWDKTYCFLFLRTKFKRNDVIFDVCAIGDIDYLSYSITVKGNWQLWKPSNMYIWAASSEFVSSSIPSWQLLTAHAQPFRGARDLAFCLKVPLDSMLVWASSEGSGETARMRRLAWTFAARIGDKHQIRLTRPIFSPSLKQAIWHL